MSDQHALLQKHFDTALESPDGIKKLRELILTLAMQGKLVKQDPSDQPASVLLKDIQQEKERLIKEGKIKRQKELPPIKPGEAPYEAPEGWEWVRLGELTSLITKGSSPNWQGVNYVDSNSGVLFITSENVDSYRLKLNNKKYVEIKFNDIEPRSILQKDDYLMNIVGASIGRVAYYDLNEIANINQAVCLIRMLSINEKIHQSFMLYFFNSNICISYMFDKQVDNARANLSMSNIAQFLIPLPPLAEQKRIVAKIDELMALCDRLEAQRNARNDKRLAVHTAAINRLLTAADKNDFDTAWQFITRHFDPLYSVKENVAELKKAILTLAMQGKLVKQDPKDQPASELLKEIQAEKEWLIKEGKIKRQKDLPPIKPEDVPYEAPKGWEWVRLGEIGNIFNGNSINENEKQLKYRGAVGLPYIGTKDVGYGYDKIKYSNGVYIPNEETKFKKARKGAVLLCSEGGSAGKKCGISEMEICFGNKLFAFEAYGEKVLPYITLAFYLTSIFSEQFNKSMTGIIGGVSINKFQEILLPLCSVDEQKRIVAKIDELMTLCDKLEAQIDQATAKQTALFDAVLAKN